MDISEADFGQAMLGMGVPEAYVECLLDLYRFIREQRFPMSSTAIRDVTGRDPISFDQFARDHVSAWKT